MNSTDTAGIFYKQGFIKYFKMNYDLYILLLPALIFLSVFKYYPMYGLVIAFKDYNMFTGIANSTWVGFEHFQKLFEDPEFYQVFFNTLIISIYKVVFLFPIPIILAILINEIRNMVFKKTIQTVVYLPHFISWVVAYGLFINVLSADGIVNNVIRYLGGDTVLFFMNNSIFRGMLVVTAGWKEVGWNTIIFLAAITAIDQQLYDAAVADGASKFKQIIYITMPGIFSTIIMLLIIRLGYILDAGFEQILVMYNPTVYKVSDIISTYIYRMGLGKMNYSFATAVGMFNSIIGFVLIVSANKISKKLLGRSIW